MHLSYPVFLLFLPVFTHEPFMLDSRHLSLMPLLYLFRTCVYTILIHTVVTQGSVAL